ncbi:hypothetical protein [Polaribacter dokdonensis]|uniref:Lipoprotein n=1 Tax=Polaribacter dokdonensis DSW-5 TaxID=1300348 RepID=A0A0M9CEV9_9FLAO|nr:hypothetical protein [Polaribacter dokdonensis]KOY51112.1 hypothetical protein I602_672 [Polaribacter dokdonensis DSW-5]SEE18456.1 hypothetical protein SAMN05444353_1107 [Polaribacter dokdonensis DSW-5]
MKTIKLIALFVTGSLTLVSCSSDETSLEANQKTSLLKTYKIQRDASGAYSLDLNLSDNTKVDNFINLEENTKEYLLSESDTQSKKQLSDNLIIDNTSMKVAFVDAAASKTEYLYVEDDNITLSAKSNKVRRLKDYSIVGESDGTYTLDFVVKKNTNVTFTFNDELQAYEVHLEKDKRASTTEFSRTLERNEGELLTIHFVNHKDGGSNKGFEALIRKPIIIIDDIVD